MASDGSHCLCSFDGCHGQEERALRLHSVLPSTDSTPTLLYNQRAEGASSLFAWPSVALGMS